MYRMTQQDRAKLGNTVVYIASRVDNLSKTKLLKLLYFMEELSVEKYKVPFLGFPFEVWQAGPVIKDIFIDLSETPALLDGFIEKKIINGGTYIKAIAEFCDDEFSDNDIDIMDSIIAKYGNESAARFVELTHKEGTLWHKVASENNLIELFEKKQLNNSDFKLDLSDKLDSKARGFYKEQLEFISTACYYSEK